MRCDIEGITRAIDGTYRVYVGDNGRKGSGEEEIGSG